MRSERVSTPGAGFRSHFDTLFADPRHFRGDCRLMRTAIRRGWLDDVPQAHRDTLIDRYERARAEREAAGFASASAQTRAILAWVRAGVEAVSADQRNEHRALRYARAGVWTGHTTGRPRERSHVGEWANRIDATAIRRRVIAEGGDVATARAIVVGRDDAGQRVAVSVSLGRVGGWRLRLVCPRCGVRRVFLYPTTSGVACRECAGIRYADRGQQRRK